MNLLRFAARTMLASYFVVNGVKAVRDPDLLAAAMEPVAKVVLPLAEKSLPPQAVPYLPEDARGLARLTGLAQVLGGISLASGIGRRGGAAVLALSLLPQVAAGKPLGKSGAAGREVLLRNLALAGGALLAAQDTEGRPTLAWRAKYRAKLLSRDAEHLKDAVTRQAASTRAALTREAQLAARAGRRAARHARRAAMVATKEAKGALA